MAKKTGISCRACKNFSKDGYCMVKQEIFIENRKERIVNVKIDTATVKECDLYASA